jgi:NAD(P)-dependent dehydrogenase (short-subunit alcohol dehydrogenase family)
MSTAFITGTSTGLGRGLARILSDRGLRVYGISRRGCDLPGVHDQRCDLSDPAAVPAALANLLAEVETLDLVVLNAGILGTIRDLTRTPLAEAKRVMDVNLWANKTVMDWLHARGLPIAQIVMISSGAAVLGNRGWGGYALSKAALHMRAKPYAHEFPRTHIAAIAPGIIDTAIMDHLCTEADADTFPALKRLRRARGTDAMPGPVAAAQRLIAVLPELKAHPSGSFIDIRELTDPDAYAALYRNKPR